MEEALRDYLSPALKSVTSDSRQVKSGCVFVAIRGESADGHQFIGQAAASGAVLVVGELPRSAFPPEISLNGVPYVQVPDSRLALAYLASQAEGNPSHDLKVVGVTGTSGKTTSTYLIESVLRAAGHRVGVIGTVNFRFGNKIYPSTHTTPGAPELQALLAEMKRDGCTAVVMEVSSHALKQRRVDFVAFDAMLFTNLSREHLDFHPDLEDYFRSKALLFTQSFDYSVRVGKQPCKAVGDDDEWGRRLLKETGGVGFGLSPQSGLSARELKIDSAGIHGQVGGVRVDSSLIGGFNAQNILGTIAVCQGLGVVSSKITEGLARLKNVPGRLERVANDKGIHVLVDYAHKPDALDKVLRTLRELQDGHRLVTVFGCGGDRDRTKRPVMGRAAVELSDHVFITSDNPRTEDPERIIQEILMGTHGHANFTVQADRRNAIHEAISQARPGDIVLIAGKGHEDYQIVGKQKHHFDDREVAAEALK